MSWKQQWISSPVTSEISRRNRDPSRSVRDRSRMVSSFPAPQSTRDRAINAVIRSTIDTSARRLGVDRRRFLQGAGAVAAALAAFELAGCSPTGTAARRSSSIVRHGHGGTFSAAAARGHRSVSRRRSAARASSSSTSTPITSSRTVHGCRDAPEIVELALSMLPAGCTDSSQLDCVDRATYLHDLFLASDTTVAMLTDLPNSGPSNAAVPFSEALKTQQITAGLVHGGASRLLVENVIAPNVGPSRGHTRRDVERGSSPGRPRRSRSIRPGAPLAPVSLWRTRPSGSRPCNTPTIWG